MIPVKALANDPTTLLDDELTAHLWTFSLKKWNEKKNDIKVKVEWNMM